MLNIEATIQRLSGAARSMLALAGSVARNRGELFALELREQAEQAVLLGVMLGVVLVLAMLGCVSATAWAIYAAGEEYRLHVLIGLTVAYGLVAGVGTGIIWFKLRRYRDKAASAMAALRGSLVGPLVGGGERVAGETGTGEDADGGEERSWHTDDRS
jgi:uncharacterized membrane protein YqjE